MTNEERNIAIADMRRMKNEYMNGRKEVAERKCKSFEMAIKALEQPQQKTGRWIDYSDDGFVECPFCGHATNCEDNIDELHYCFYCGARMVEPQESEVSNE